MSQRDISFLISRKSNLTARSVVPVAPAVLVFAVATEAAVVAEAMVRMGSRVLSLMMSASTGGRAERVARAGPVESAVTGQKVVKAGPVAPARVVGCLSPVGRSSWQSMPSTQMSPKVDPEGLEVPVKMAVTAVQEKMGEMAGQAVTEVLVVRLRVIASYPLVGTVETAEMAETAAMAAMAEMAETVETVATADSAQEGVSMSQAVL
jgi:hypothetical protein